MPTTVEKIALELLGSSRLGPRALLAEKLIESLDEKQDEGYRSPLDKRG